MAKLRVTGQDRSDSGAQMAVITPERRREAALLAAVWVVFTAAVLTVAAHHDPWFDEAQAWLNARDNSLFNLIFHRLRYEGSPGLWHFLLWILARSGAPFRSISVLSALMASATAALMLAYAPFPPWMRALLVFGYFPAYQYAVVARSYSLNLLLMVLAAILYPARNAQPLRYCLVLAALANANAFGFLAAGVLFVDFASSTASFRTHPRRILTPASIFLIAALLAVLQAVPARDVSFPGDHHMTVSDILPGAITQMMRAFVEVPSPALHPPVSAVQKQAASGQAIRFIVGMVLSTGILAVGLALAAKAKKLTLVALLCGLPLAFQVIVYYAPWHAGTVYLAWVFGIWISWAALEKLRVGQRRGIIFAITLLFVVHAYDALAAWRLDLSNHYSAAPKAAAFLQNYFALNQHQTLGCVGVFAFAVQPYFRQNICGNYYGGAPKPSYYDFKVGQRFPVAPLAPYVAGLMRAGQFDTLLISERGLAKSEIADDARSAGYCPLGNFEGNMIWKDYFSLPDNLLIVQKCGLLKVEPAIRRSATPR